MFLASRANDELKRGGWPSSTRAGDIAFAATVLAIVGLKHRREAPRALAVGALSWAHAAILVALAPLLLLFILGLQFHVRWVFEATGLFERPPPSYVPSLWSEVLHVRETGTILGVVSLLVFQALHPAVLEEVFFRGFIGRGLLARRGLLVGIGVTSLLFGALHYSSPQRIAGIGLWAVVVHATYLWSRSLLAPMLLHLLHDGLVVGLGFVDGGSFAARIVRGALNGSCPHLLATLAASAALCWLFWTLRSQWLLPDGTAWRPGYPTAERPPRELGARLVRGRGKPAPLVASAVLGGAFLALAAVEPNAPATEPDAKEVGPSASGDTPPAKLAARASASGDKAHPERRLLLAVEAWRASQEAGETWSPEVLQALVDAVRDARSVHLPGAADAAHASFSPDGRWVAVARWAFGKSVSLLRADGQGETLELQGPDVESFRHVEWSPDGRRVLASTHQGAMLWAVSDPTRPRSFHGCAHAAFSSDGKGIALATEEGIEVHGLDEPERIVLTTVDHRKPTRVAWSPDGRRVAAQTPGAVEVWDPARPSEPVLVGSCASPDRIAWSPDGRSIAIACETETRIHRADGAGAPLVLHHEKGVHALEWAPDGKLLCAGFSDHASVFRADGQGSPVVLQSSVGTVDTIDFAPSGDRVLLGNEFLSEVFRTTGGPPLHSLRGLVRPGPDGLSFLVSTETDAWIDNVNALGERSVPKGAPLIEHAFLGVILDVSPDGRKALVRPRRLVLSPDDVPRMDEVELIDVDTVEALGFFREHERDEIPPVLGPDGARAVTIAGDGKARIWNADSLVWEVELRGHSGQILGAAWSPDGRRVATASEDGTARIWSADGTGSPVVRRASGAAFTSIAWSPDGQSIAVGSVSGMVRVYPADGLGVATLFYGHRAKVGAIAWSPDGRRILTGSRDGEVRLWAVDGRSPTWILSGHEDEVLSACMSRDGDRVLTASRDGTVRLWSADGRGGSVVVHKGPRGFRRARFSTDGDHVLEVGQRWPITVRTTSGQLLASRACSIAGRNFTSDEWSELFPDRPLRPTCPAPPDAPLP